MKTLTIFHDPQCGLCRQFRLWLEGQPRFCEVEFRAFNSAEAIKRFPKISRLNAAQDVVILADDGRWWQGPAAWLTCLWITRNYRDWSYRLAKPSLLPLVRKCVHLLSENRLQLSRLLRLHSEKDLRDELQSQPAPECSSGICQNL
ncbi:DUF393 domain-containing protein [Luteolibacter pohnpeiensis]|uniref:DUF393 domain-containing protein n=1 Tax=Luteolibacter pohnpeiensis TaxID=454153 RepID=A0A934S7I6_9BACT|nr:DCC1-like thiol-disulfide oxidoreductase family protein [Luteolibacter pohnpeiensis]MBK1880794.1 DUF393 domain-containing protein [Luteolibacter pohnpeiensis]